MTREYNAGEMPDYPSESETPPVTCDECGSDNIVMRTYQDVAWEECANCGAEVSEE